MARIGGDEFAILLPRVSRETVENIMVRLKTTIEVLNSDNPEFLLSISTGLAISHSKSTNLNLLFREADNNMYREKNNNSQQIRAAITRTVVHLLEQRDYIIEGHTRRVATLCESLALEMGFPKEQIRDLLLLAEYHDLGKVGIAETVLFKEGPLNAAELKEVQRHSEIGHRIALSVMDIRHIADWILKHQEWWNGKGYPLGLTGEQIRLSAEFLQSRMHMIR